MRTAICLTFLLCFIHFATPKIYVIDLTNDSHEDNSIKLRELLELLENPNEKRFKEIKPDKTILEKRVPCIDDDCLSLATTKAEKVKCLKNLVNGRPKKSIGRGESIFYPGLYHEFYAQRPKRKIYSFYNYYGGLLKSKPSFTTDLTREFSQDYLDVGELSRIDSNCPECLQDSKNKDNKYKLRIDSKIGVPRRSNKRVEQTSDSSEESSDSSDTDMRNDRRDRKRRKPNRFQVVFNDDASPESDEETEKNKPQKSFSSESEEAPTKTTPETSNSNSESESVEVTEKPVKMGGKYSYLQGNKVYDSFRRRLQHFLPKRFHWDEDDIHHLGYYWFDGPRGKYS